MRRHCVLLEARREHGCTGVATKGIYERFIAEMRRKISELRIGHSLDVDSQIGPMASREQFERDLSYIALARSAEGSIVGGEPLTRGSNGFCAAESYTTVKTGYIRA